MVASHPTCSHSQRTLEPQGELDVLLKEEKEKKLVQEKLAAGESPVTATDYKLYQVSCCCLCGIILQ